MNGNGKSISYQVRQAGKNAQYRREYQTWVRKLPSTEREKLRQLNVDRPLMDYHVSESVSDISDRNLAEVEQAPQPQPSNDNERLMRVFLRIASSANPALEVDTMGFVFGFNIHNGLSGTQIATKYGLSRAAFSKRCKECQREFRALGILPSRAMKSEIACQTYALTNGAMKTKCN